MKESRCANLPSNAARKPERPFRFRRWFAANLLREGEPVTPDRRFTAGRASRLPPQAFTLVELLVVMAVIGILAAMVMPILGAITRNKIRAVARAELAQLETAIGAYQAKLGFYPPDNPGNPAVNQLYYELLGTTMTNLSTGPAYVTLDGSAQMLAGSVSSTFGNANVSGFMNCTRGATSDEVPAAVNFLKGLKPNQVGQYLSKNKGLAKVLIGPAAWPNDPNYPTSNNPGLNPWRYNSSNPAHNPNSYDLWIDLVIGGKTNRISNWNKQPVVVTAPYP